MGLGPFWAVVLLIIIAVVLVGFLVLGLHYKTEKDENKILRKIGFSLLEQLPYEQLLKTAIPYYPEDETSVRDDFAEYRNKLINQKRTEKK
jgi:hypothetical protein